MNRVVISGLGVASPIGNTLKKFSQNLFEGNCGIGTIDTFDTSKYRFNIGATVKDENLELSSKERSLPRPISFAIHATRQALNQSGVAGAIDPKRIGVYFAGPACCVFETENFYRDYLEKGLDQTSVYDLAYATWDSAVNEIGYNFNLLGPRNTVLTACSSSGVAIGTAYDLIRLGIVDAMVAGGTDGFSELTFSGFQSLQNISPVPCSPFDKSRQGLSFGEGAGCIVLESYESAIKRGATILAELVGYGAVSEGYNLTAPDPDAYGYIKVMSRALQMANVDPGQVSHVNAHGTATSINDVTETKAISKVFGRDDVYVTSVKSLVGHCMGAAGAIEAVASIVSLLEQKIPGTAQFKEKDPDVMAQVVSQTIDCKMEYVLSNSSGFGGNNSSLLFRGGKL